jgi:hypothetical protein
LLLSRIREGRSSKKFKQLHKVFSTKVIEPDSSQRPGTVIGSKEMAKKERVRRESFVMILSRN